MLQDTISDIEAKIQNSAGITPDHRAELLKLLAGLKSEINGLSKTHSEQADSIAAFTQVSTLEATRQSKNPESLNHSISGLKSSVLEFEGSHPQLVAIVNRISALLANMGI